MSFPRYPKYKPSGVEWLGEVPAHWEVKPLKHVVNLKSGGTPSRANLAYWDGDVPWASSKDIKTETLADTEDHITQQALADDTADLVPASSLLIVVRGMILAHTFPVTKTLVPMAINQDLKAVTPSHTLQVDFLAWLLRGSAAETLARTDEAGHGTRVLRLDAWTSMGLPLPRRQEQSAIAAFLDRETAKIDALVAEQRRLIELLREKRQAVISHAVTKGLNPDAPMKPSGIEWLGDVPAHWTVERIKHRVRSLEQGWSPQCESSPVEAEDVWGVLKVGCVNGGTFRPMENKRLPKDLTPLPDLAIGVGDLLISRANTRELVGGAAVAERDYPNLMLCDKLYRLRFEPNRCNSRFVSCYLASSAARSRVELDATGASASMVNISQSAIRDLELAVPPINEQEQIVRSLDVALKDVDALTAEAQRAIDLLQERRSALISAAVTGQIDVRGLVPSEAA